MGSKLGPSYACLFVGYQEHLISTTYPGPFPDLLKRYIDDTIGASSLPLQQLQDFIDFICKILPRLRGLLVVVDATRNGLPLSLTGTPTSPGIFAPLHFRAPCH